MPTIKEIRNSKAMTQAHLADAAQVSVETVRRLEKGKSVQSENLLAICSVLGILPQDVCKPEISEATRRESADHADWSDVEEMAGSLPIRLTSEFDTSIHVFLPRALYMAFDGRAPFAGVLVVPVAFWILGIALFSQLISMDFGLIEGQGSGTYWVSLAIGMTLMPFGSIIYPVLARITLNMEMQAFVGHPKIDLLARRASMMQKTESLEEAGTPASVDR